MNLTDSQYRAVVAHAQRVAAAVARETVELSNKKLECAVAQNVRLTEENTRLYADLEELRTRLWKQSSYNRQTSTSARLGPDQPNDGDKWVDMAGQETFTFFRGEWRRQSELEGFASAAKYL